MQGGTAYDALVRKDRGFSFCDTRMMDGGVRNRSGTALMRLPDRKVGEAFFMRNGGAAPDPSTQFSLFRLYMIEHPTFHSAQDDEMLRGVLIALRAVVRGA